MPAALSPTGAHLTSCRSTYGRMPPWRNATSSSGVSMRAVAVNSLRLPSAPSRTTRIVSARRQSPRRCRGSRSCSRPVSSSDAAFCPSLNCSGSTPMFTRLLRWMRSKLSAMHRLDAEQQRALRRPVARRSGAVLLAGRSRAAARRASLVLHRRVVDRHHLAVRLVASSSRLRCRARAGCAGGCWRTCRASSLRDCRGARRTS